MLDVVLAYVLMLFGASLTLRLKLYSPKRVWGLIRHAFLRNPKNKGGISPLAGLCTALAGSIGTGNITGVCGAILIGGPGAIFWMWISTFFSASLKYSEVYLAIAYKPKDARMSKMGILGSPMLYMEKGLGRSMKPLAVLFAALCVVASFGIGNAVQSNAVAQTWVSLLMNAEVIDGESQAWFIKFITGFLLALWLGYAMAGGAKRISKFASLLVPLMGGLYIICAGAVIIGHADRIIPALRAICRCAFMPEAFVGGTAGGAIVHAMSCGISHGTFSNEAGMGSSPMAHAATNSQDPKKQGALGIIEVYADTLVICTVTALLILTSVESVPYGDTSVSYMAIVQSALASVLGESFSGVALGVIMPLFAVSSMLTWSYYGKVCILYLFGEKAVAYYFAVFCIVAFAGACIRLDALWSISSVLNMLMAVPNMFSLALLARKIE